MRLLALLTLLVSVNCYSIEIVKPFRVPDVLALDFVKATLGVDSFADVDLTERSGVIMELVCSGNPIHKNKRSFFHLKNYYNLDIGDYYFENNEDCHELAEYIGMTFEGINSDHSLYVEVDIENKVVSKLIYPDLNPYILYPEYDKENYRILGDEI